jgi:hypothetical protein
MKANRGDVQGMTQIAIQEAQLSGETRYLVPTARGFVVDITGSWSKHLRIDPDGSVWQIGARFSEAGATETRIA